ncbi:P-type conjugative transfer protein VirB9 [Campylobacter fetus subsp. venerealis]|uniref:Type IV secretion system protein VirB9, putative n=1 Tax=Campylobacter hyointestinalis subsp. hyointestinalis TaxID=91352 RepID=A0A9W5ARK1_CAMHY|nr:MULTISPECIES: P-type conjugative transfer protein VirB9 [Campylobacter]MBC3781448.1 P-type conjugative transfer protein VirB9 [Campylobacter fetus subsp. fetus]MBC3782904.1 P-type conjugative transfer protein VirB9 [Campylobacter fetus subsp. venerealis]MBK3499224.1 P-type conjugative transfer protein VirB9 [Campylobacter fetus subsp. venerealis]MBK3501167.1 P-type conjugative transfer protein VirB9 [Campylobacter fetus subsp. venerealis]MBK3503186.1 P-type conjugative transfer protein VirB
MKKAIFAISLGLSSVFALNIPNKSLDDGRITYANYNANDVFKINAKNGFVTVLEFDKNEKIINTATGFAEGWDLIEKGNLLFIKPKAYKTNLAVDDGSGEMQQQEFVVDPTPKEWKTNLIVVTDVNSYVFDLILVTDINNATYKLKFSYPEKIKEIRETEKAKEKEFIEDQKINVELEKTSVPRNWNFVMKVNNGSEDIAPNFAYDDGVFTYLGFDNTKTFPAVFLFENDNESILNTHVKKDGNFDVLVIHKVAKEILLRSGDKVVGIKNNGYGQNPLPKTKEVANDEILERKVNDPKRVDTKKLEDFLLRNR